MILGLGIDLVEVARMEKAVARGDRLVRRIFTPDEVAYCTRHRVPARHYAARFAAKEAGMKAIGTGWSSGVGWQDFEVRHDPRGRPLLVVRGRAAQVARAMGGTHVTLSIAHDGGFATAVVALEGEARGETEAWLTGRAALTLPATEDVIGELLGEEPAAPSGEPEAGA